MGAVLQLYRYKKAYHVPLQRIFGTLKEKYKDDEPELLLRYVIKGLNCTMGPNGLDGSLVGFSTLPKFPMINRLSPS